MGKLKVIVLIVIILAGFPYLTEAQSHCSPVSFSNPGPTTWSVPNGLTSVNVRAIGGGGGGGGSGQGGATAGQSGRYTNQNLGVTPGALNVWVGGGGERGSGGLTSCGGCGDYCPGTLWVNNWWGYDHLGRGSPYGYAGGVQGYGIGCYWSHTATGGWGGGGGGSSAVSGSGGTVIASGGYGGLGGYNAGSGYAGGYLSPYSLGGHPGYGGAGGWLGAGGAAGYPTLEFVPDGYGGGYSFISAHNDGGNGAGGYVGITPLTWSPETTCNDGVDDDCDGTIDCADPNCAGQTGPGGVRCCQNVGNCIQQECGIESCSSNVCSATSRPLCDATECTAGKYCETSTGLCKAPDESSDVCLSCAADQTAGLSWTVGNHQDAGKGYGATYFDGDGACTLSLGGNCFDANNNAVSHKTALTSGACCGDDANEYYKSNYYGAECTSSVNDCVWSDGNATSSNTGNVEWWCYIHEWNECADNAIGTKVGGVTCAGVVGTRAWTVHANVLGENQYSCTDGKDNDGDGAIDCDDTDCTGSLGGVIKDADDNGIFDVVAKTLTGTMIIGTDTTDNEGNYAMNIRCGTFNLVLEHVEYATVTRIGVVVVPGQQTIVNFEGTGALAKVDSCESDCTFPGSSIIHESCSGRNGCEFYDTQAALVCDNAQPGWTREYDDVSTVVCPNGTPETAQSERAVVQCSSEICTKTSTPVLYNGQQVKMVVVVAND